VVYILVMLHVMSSNRPDVNGRKESMY